MISRIAYYHTWPNLRIYSNNWNKRVILTSLSGIVSSVGSNKFIIVRYAALRIIIPGPTFESNFKREIKGTTQNQHKWYCLLFCWDWICLKMISRVVYYHTGADLRIYLKCRTKDLYHTKVSDNTSYLDDNFFWKLISILWHRFKESIIEQDTGKILKQRY